MATFRSASAGNGGANNVTSYPTTLPTGWQAGDLVIYEVTIGHSNGSLNSLTGWTIYDAQDQNTGGAGHATGIAYRVMQAGDASPTFTSPQSAKYAWSAICIQPGAGETLALEASQPAVAQNTTGSTTLVAPNSGTATGTDVSVLFYGCRAIANSATAINVTATPSGWTEGADSSTAAGTTTATRQSQSAVAYKDNATGTQTPGTGTLNVSATQNGYQLLVKPTGGGGTPGDLTQFFLSAVA